MWILDLDPFFIGWVLTGIKLGVGTDSEEGSLRVVDSEDWGWTEVDSEEVDVWDTWRDAVGEWIEVGEKPGGTRGAEGEWEWDNWEDWGVGAIDGGDKLGLRLK